MIRAIGFYKILLVNWTNLYGFMLLQIPVLSKLQATAYYVIYITVFLLNFDG